MSQSFQPQTQNNVPKSMQSTRMEPITQVPPAKIPFSQGLEYPQEKIVQNVVPSAEDLDRVAEEQVIKEQTAVYIPDFTYGRSLSTSFCMRCGAQAEYFGKSRKLNFSKKLCGDCVKYYAETLNV